MNNKKTMMKLMMTTLACVALGTTAVAAPKGGVPPAPARQDIRSAKAKPKAQPKAPARPSVAKHDTKRGHDVARHVAHPEPRHIAPPPPPPPPRNHKPEPPRHHLRHHDHHDDNDGWLMLGAGIIGGIIAAIAG